ncbi:MAG: hypothetical protein ACTSRI_08425 [Promethearchaeota archaeon]
MEDRRGMGMGISLVKKILRSYNGKFGFQIKSKEIIQKYDIILF